MGSFASHTKSDPIPVPFDPPHTITVRQLTGQEYEEAQAAHARGIASGRNWSNRFRTAISAGIATDEQVSLAVSDPLLGYDRLAMAQAGLVAWSFKDGDKPKKLTPAAVADMSDELLELVALEVLKLTKPALFETKKQAERERKND